MYQTLDDLGKIQNSQNKLNRVKRWVIRILILIWFIVCSFVILNAYNWKNKEKLSLQWLSYYPSSGNNAVLTDGNLFSWIFQLEPGDASEDTQSENMEILSQLKDESFWNKKIEESIEKEFDSERRTKWNIKIIWYWLLCDQYNENLKNCKYRISFSNEVNRWWRTGYEVYSNSSSTSSRYGFSYHIAAKEIAMDDIWNWGVFYDVSNPDYEDELKLKYLWENFESTYDWDYRFIEVVSLLTNNNDWTSNYYLYIIWDEMWKILYKNYEKLISIGVVKRIIAENVWISVDDVRYLYLRANNLVYEVNFSYDWHTYDFKIDAKNWDILNGVDDVDIWDEKAMEIALKDSWLKSSDLRRDVGHWHWEMKMLLMPDVTKEGTGINAVYKVEIETEDYKLYTYKIQTTNGKILSKQLSEYFVIISKNWETNNVTYKIQSLYGKKKKLDIDITEINMDDIYEFKDSIYLWITFDWSEITDWEIIDRSYKNLWKKTRNELDKYYHFESYYPIKEVYKKINWNNPDEYTIYLSSINENIIYKYTIMTWQDCGLKIINDLWKDIIVYQNEEEALYPGKFETYRSNIYLKDWYPWRRWNSCTTNKWEKYYYLMYEEVSSDDLFKIIDRKEITYLSKFKVWDEISLNQRHNENYLYNDTNSDLTISVTDYWIVDAPEDFQFTVKPWKFAHCYEYTDIVKIIK